MYKSSHRYPKKFKKQYLHKLHQKHIDEVCRMLDRPEPTIVSYSAYSTVTGIWTIPITGTYTGSSQIISWPIPKGQTP